MKIYPLQFQTYYDCGCSCCINDQCAPMKDCERIFIIIGSVIAVVLAVIAIITLIIIIIKKCKTRALRSRQ